MKAATFPYIGSKNKVVNQLTCYLPLDYSEFREIFCGSASLSVHLMKLRPKAKYWLNDAYRPIWCVWNTLKEDPRNLVAWLLDFKHRFPVEELSEFSRLTIEDDAKADKDHLAIAGKCLINCLTNYGALPGMRGSFSPRAAESKFKDASILSLLNLGRLLQTVDVKITNLPWQKCIGGQEENVLIFADPPYDSDDRPDLYGYHGELHKDFQKKHGDFAGGMRNCRHKWAISYNDTPKIRRLFADYEKVPYDLSYSIRNFRQSIARQGQEILITNYDPYEL